jgi:hypothetical protein
LLIYPLDFGVSLLNKSYDVPFVWRHNLSRIFPGEKALTRDEASRLCDGRLDLRNLVAHHEPIYHVIKRGMSDYL